MGRIEDAATPDGRDLLRYMGTIRRTAMIARDRLGVDPDDVAQETCLNLLHVSDADRRASRYVARATWNTATGMRRKADSIRRLAKGKGESPPNVPPSYISIDVRAALDALPPEQAEALKAIHGGGLTCGEVGRAIGVGKSTVHRRAVAGASALAVALAAYAPDAS